MREAVYQALLGTRKEEIKEDRFKSYLGKHTQQEISPGAGLCSIIWMNRASLVAQWLRTRLPMQGTRVRAPVWEDPTCPCLYLGWKPQFMFMTVGSFFNVYILSNKLWEDFLAILSSVRFTVISCIAIYWNWVFIFAWGRIWEYSSVWEKKKEACCNVTENLLKVDL